VLKRLTWLVVGFSAGLGSSWYVTRSVRRAVARYTPRELAGRVSGSLVGAGRDLRAAVTEGRVAMHERETELRAELARPSAR
jgi:hypothetical protein